MGPKSSVHKATMAVYNAQQTYLPVRKVGRDLSQEGCVCLKKMRHMKSQSHDLVCKNESSWMWKNDGNDAGNRGWDHSMQVPKNQIRVFEHLRANDSKLSQIL